MTTGPALRTDHYELTMLDASLGSGLAERRAVFEVFTRYLPRGRGYGVVAGTGRLAPMLAGLSFRDDDVAGLAATGAFSERLIAYLADYRFDGDVWGHREGEIFVPNEPVLVVETTFAAGLVLETLVLSVLNHDSAVAAAAARMHEVAGGRALIEMGSRRTHEEAAVDAARAAWLAGFDATSNLAAGVEHGIPTTGTASHAFTLAHDSERAAFAAQIAAQGLGTTLLVDTYDISTGIDHAVEAARAAGGRPGAVRIDSGDLALESAAARARLDAAGADTTRIVVSGDLDEFRLAGLAYSPVDAYGVGTSVVTGSGHAAAGLVYKLVGIGGDDGELVPVAKESAGKATRGGRVWPHRRLVGGTGVGDVLTPGEAGPVASRPLHVPVVRAGELAYRWSLTDDRAHHQAARAEVPAAGRALHAQGPAWAVEVGDVGERDRRTARR